MADNGATNGISMPHSMWAHVHARGKELGLPEAKARSLFIQMLVDLDQQVRFKKYAHEADSSFRFYPEKATLRLVAEDQAIYGETDREHDRILREEAAKQQREKDALEAHTRKTKGKHSRSAP